MSQASIPRTWDPQQPWRDESGLCKAQSSDLPHRATEEGVALLALPK